MTSRQIHDRGFLFNLVKFGEGKLIAEFLTERNGKLKIVSYVPKTSNFKRKEKDNTDLNKFDYYRLMVHKPINGQFAKAESITRDRNFFNGLKYEYFIFLSLFGELIKKLETDLLSLEKLFQTMEALSLKIQSGGYRPD